MQRYTAVVSRTGIYLASAKDSAKKLKKDELRGILLIIGIALMLDGIGSIFVQPDQHFFFFQFVRLLRATAGEILIYSSFAIKNMRSSI